MIKMSKIDIYFELIVICTIRKISLVGQCIEHFKDQMSPLLNLDTKYNIWKWIFLWGLSRKHMCLQPNY